MLLASLGLGACSSSDGDSNSDGNENGNGNAAAYTETTLSDAPDWQIDWSNNQERPNWTDPDEIYGNWTILRVQIEEMLQPYVSSDDLMAVFVNGELRGLANPATNLDGELMGKAKFIIKAWGNETGTEMVNISLQYYSQKLKHLFTLSDNIVLNSDETTGIDEVYIPEFTYGSAKYPVVKTVSAESLLAKVGLTSVQGNLVGAFVGDECRGITTLSSGSTPLVIYGRSEGESVTLKCYDAAKEVLYTIPDVVKI